MSIRESPDINSGKNVQVLNPGDTFLVSKEERGSDEVLYLQLADGRGWVFDHIPGKGAMCHRLQDTRIPCTSLNARGRVPLEATLQDTHR